ncbi:unnamed protein product [Mytilus coruscus]|uniref:Uncharacterized protein n=1 Tax=Mytilus coruscus TaxID=42192 RepID=A0A6J8C6T3_MYTCO|nr:unnamed protein product [Mytilus coruscus]
MMRFCITDMLGEPQREALINLLCLMEEAFGSTIDMDKFNGFEKRWHQGVGMLERDFPVSLQCEEIRGQTDEQASQTSWNVIPHLAPRPEPPRCCLRILGFEPEPVLIPVAFPELPSNNKISISRQWYIVPDYSPLWFLNRLIKLLMKLSLIKIKMKWLRWSKLCEEIRGQTDEQASQTSWNVIPHLAPRPEPPRCSLRILGLEPEPVLIPVTFPELPSNNQTEYFTTVVHRARLFSVMVPKPDNLIADEVIIDKDEMVEVEQAREELLDRFKMQKRSALK